MRQRDIYWVDLNPVKGSEQRGIRPVVVISGNAMNEHFEVAIVCPLSTKIKNYAGCIVIPKDEKNQLPSDSEVITFQIRTISKDRFLQKIGEITAAQLEAIRHGLNEVLTY